MQPCTRCTWASFSTDVFSPLPYQKITGTFFSFSKTNYTNNLHYAPALSKIFSNSILISSWSYPHSDLYSCSTTTHYFQTLRIVCRERQLKYLLNKLRSNQLHWKSKKAHHWSEAVNKCKGSEWCWWRAHEWKLWGKGAPWPPAESPRGRGRGDVLPRPGSCWRRAWACTEPEWQCHPTSGAAPAWVWGTDTSCQWFYTSSQSPEKTATFLFYSNGEHSSKFQ